MLHKLGSGVVVLALAGSVASAQQSPTLAERVLLFAMAEDLVNNSLLQLHDATVREYGTVPTPMSLVHVQSKLERTLGESLHITVVADKSFNASAYPNGKILVNQGLIEFVNGDEDMMAAVVGHEIAHIQKKHSVKRFQQRLLVDTFVSSLLLKSDYESLAPIITSAITMRFSRDEELEADRIGFVYAVRSGYRPEAGHDVWVQVGQAFSGPTGLFEEMLSTHPPSEYRARQMEKYAESYREGVPLDWIEAGKTSSDLNKEIGAPPDVIVGESVFMKVLMNLPGSAYTMADYPRFAVLPHAEGYVSIVKLSPDGKVGVLLPNPFDRLGLAQVDGTIEVPSPTYRSLEGEPIRLRWDQQGVFRYMFVLSERRLDMSLLDGARSTAEELEQRVREVAKSQGVLVIDTATAKISVARKGRG